MRPSGLLSVILFVLGCAQQSALRAPILPTDKPLRVRLHQPTAGALQYTLSEPGYVAIFSVMRGRGVSLLYPYFDSQVDHRSHAGMNQETVHGGSAGWGYTAGGRNEHRALFGYADAYYVIASKYPLPVEGMIQSPYLLRTLIGTDRFRATNLSATWEALETMLVDGLPDDAWASDVYLNWRDPFARAYLDPRAYLQHCNDGLLVFYSSVFFNTGSCNPNVRNATVTPPIQVAVEPRRDPPKQPLDRDPSVPLPPDAGIARTWSLRNAMIRGDRTPRSAEPGRAAAGRPAPAAGEQLSAPPPSVASKPSPPTPPSPDQASRPKPEPDN